MGGQGVHARAKAIAAAVRDPAEAGHEQAATKGDLAAALAKLKAELLERIQASERRTYAAVFAPDGLLFAALKLIP